MARNEAFWLRDTRRGSKWECGDCGEVKITDPAHTLAHVPKHCGQDMKYRGGKFRFAADEPLSSSTA